MNKKSIPFCPAAPLFAAYYLLTPIFLAATGLPFVGSFFSASTLVCLGLSVVLFLRKNGLAVAVFTLVGAFLQLSPLFYFISQLFKGAVALPTFLGILKPLFSIAALGLITLFAVLLSRGEAKTEKLKRLWFLPVIFEGVSFSLALFDQLWQASLSDGINYLPFILNLVLMLVYSVAVILTAVWYGMLSKNFS